MGRSFKSLVRMWRENTKDQSSTTDIALAIFSCQLDIDTRCAFLASIVCVETVAGDNKGSLVLFEVSTPRQSTPFYFIREK